MAYILTFLILFSSAQAKFCKEWGEPIKVGALDYKIIDESSGMIISRNIKDRFYHINDSGDGGYFYSSKLDGTNTQKIKISKFHPSDTEDMSYGPCGDSKCIFIGDIGDNSRSRNFLTIIGIEEQEIFSESAPIKISKDVYYPIGPQNCEAMAVHPFGDIFLITKVIGPGEHAKIYKLSSSLLNGDLKKLIKLEFLGDLNLKKLVKEKFPGSRITGMTISPDGEKFAILTYGFAMEFNINLANLTDWESLVIKEGENFNLIKLEVLPQQEAITYSMDGLKLYYSTEKTFLNSELPIMEISCKN